ncbi:hypothetical protein C8R43DRAFT_958999 [Mycena crocata]|nr:hypothetical protein C8R43DRAFT_958999 [Mycena crocata]
MPLHSQPSRPPSPSVASELEHQQAKVAALKQKIAELEVERDTMAKVASNKTGPTVKSFKNMGRALRKVASMFDPLEALIAERDRRLEQDEKRDLECDTSPIIYTAEQKRLFRGYEVLVEVIPGIKAAIVSCDVHELSHMLSQLRLGASGAMGDDNNSTRAAIIDWIEKSLTAPLSPSSRVNRGIEGDVTGPLLFPVDYDYNDLVVRAKVINGDDDFRITADQWPRGVYQNGVYDPANPEKGLFKASSLLQTYMHIFTSPKSAKAYEEDGDEENRPPGTEEPPRKRKKRALAATKQSVAARIGMRRTTPRSIAYAACEHRFNLSDAPQWNETDGDFDYVLYYNNIVDWFEDAPGPVAQKKVDDLLAWWDQRVFKSSGRSTVAPRAGNARSSVQTMRERRAAEELNV